MPKKKPAKKSKKKASEKKPTPKKKKAKKGARKPATTKKKAKKKATAPRKKKSATRKKASAAKPKRRDRQFSPDAAIGDDAIPAEWTGNVLVDANQRRELYAARDALRAFLQSARTSISGRVRKSTRGELPGADIKGIGIGLKRVAGELTDTMAVKVLVSKKLAKTAIDPAALVPETINGLPTDVEVVDEARALAAGFDRRFARPVPCGVSCAHFAVGAGTIGALVGLSDGTLAILSNNHVLANVNDAAPFEVILQPGRLDNGSLATDKIGVLAKFIRLSFTSTNLIDAAVAHTKHSLVQASHVTYRLNPSPRPPFPGMRVIKNGRATGETRGTVVDVGMDVNVKYGQKRAHFDEQIKIQGDGSDTFSKVGDSGSLIVSEDTHQPIALLFAADSRFAYANPISTVMSALGISFFLAP